MSDPSNMRSLLVKVCGLNDAENITGLQSLPVDLLGLIFYPPSPRYVGRTGLRPADIPGGAARRVGVFVDTLLPELLKQVERFQLDFVQLHGGESPEYCRELQQVWPSVELIKAFGVDRNFDFSVCASYEGLCRYFLFDTKSPDHGGSGRRFSWEKLHEYQGRTPFLLSGGIGPSQIGELQQFRHPQWAGIDLNSRFESRPGVKEVEKLRPFLQALLAPTTDIQHPKTNIQP